MLASRTYGKAIISFLIILYAGGVRAEAKDWRGIEPLRSTRVDVERLLGSPSTDRSSIVFYRLERERVSVTYAEGPCGVGSSLWNVPRGTVISIRITPNQLSLAELKLDESKYKKKRDGQVRHIVHYINADEGVSYDVDSSAGDMVTAVEYSPAAKDEHLRCPSSVESLKDTTKFDSYSNISFEDEKKRLDSFAIQLRKYEPVEGYVIVYAGKQEHNGEVIARAERVKGYLVQVRGIDVNNLVTIDGGRRKDPTVELYLVPSGANPPPLSPTIGPNEVPGY